MRTGSPPAPRTASSYCGRARSAYSRSPEYGTGMAMRGTADCGLREFFSVTTESCDRSLGKMDLLELQHFFFFGFAHLFHPLDFVVGELLDFVEGALLVVLGNLLVFHRLLDGVVTITTDVADCGAVFFENFMQMLDHVLAPLFGQRRNRHTDKV